MSRCNTIIAAALAAAALAAPTALAQLPDIHTELSESAAPAREPRSAPFRAEIPDPVRDLRSLDPRDAVRAVTPSGRTAARPDTTGNPNVSAGAAAPAVALSTGEEVARLPFVLAVVGALVVGLGAGSGLQLLRVRRRHAGVLPT
jgi:hypothetical protein